MSTNHALPPAPPDSVEAATEDGRFAEAEDDRLGAAGGAPRRERGSRRERREPMRVDDRAVTLDDGAARAEEGVIPTPNGGGSADPEFDEEGRPDASSRALVIGIAYCFPAGEPGSTCTPVGSPPPASAVSGTKTTSTARAAASTARIQPRLHRFSLLGPV
jgi:hypothetical protein